MAKAVLLTNPDLNDEDVTVTHSAARGREVGQPVADAGNSELMLVQTSGDAGDSIDHTFAVDGSQEQPTYKPDSQWTDPVDFREYSTDVVTGISGGYIVSCDDRAWAITLAKTGTDTWALKLWRANGTDLTAVTTKTLTFDETKWNLTSVGATGGRSSSQITAAVFVQDITNADNRASRVRWFRADVSTGSPAWAVLGTQKIVDMVPGLVQADDFVSMDGHLDVEFDGSVWVLAFQIRESNTEVAGSSASNESEIMICTAASPTEMTFTRFFGGGVGGEWWWQPRLGYSPHWGFILTATRAASNTTTRSIRTRHSTNGTTWENVIPQTGTPARVFNGFGVAVAAENKRVYLFWNEGDGTDNMNMRWFNGDEDDDDAWSAITAVEVPSAVQVDGDEFIAATNWRGEIWVATVGFSGSTVADQLEVIRSNILTASDTGILRELPLGERVFVAGLFDDTETALFIRATGSVVAGDSWTIPVAFQFEGLNVLREALGETWRTDDNGTPDIVLDAGSGLAFVVDAVALFGINLPAWTFQMNDSDSWSSPTVSQSVSAVVSTVTVSSSKGNRVVMTTSPWERAQFVKRPHWVELSTGIFRILDNGDDYLIVDGSPGSPTGTATVFGDRAGHIFSSLNVHQFARIVAPSAKQTPDDLYEIARVIFGAALVLPQDYAIRWREERAALNEVVDLRPGARVAAALNARKRNVWRLRIPPAVEVTSIAPVRDFVSLADGVRHQIAWWPEGSGDAQACFLSRFGDDALEAAHVMGTGAADRHDELPELIIREEV